MPAVAPYTADRWDTIIIIAADNDASPVFPLDVRALGRWMTVSRTKLSVVKRRFYIEAYKNEDFSTRVRKNGAARYSYIRKKNPSE